MFEKLQASIVYFFRLKDWFNFNSFEFYKISGKNLELGISKSSEAFLFALILELTLACTGVCPSIFGCVSFQKFCFLANLTLTFFLNSCLKMNFAKA